MNLVPDLHYFHCKPTQLYQYTQLSYSQSSQHMCLLFFLFCCSTWWSLGDSASYRLWVLRLCGGWVLCTEAVQLAQPLPTTHCSFIMILLLLKAGEIKEKDLEWSQSACSVFFSDPVTSHLPSLSSSLFLSHCTCSFGIKYVNKSNINMKFKYGTLFFWNSSANPVSKTINLLV